MSGLPWTLKHRPRRLEEIVGNQKSRQAFLDWLAQWDRKPPPKRAVLLHGPPGTGKTVTVEAAARELLYDLIELNASDTRSGDALRRIAGTASGEGLLFKGKRLILLDEVDGIDTSQDRGAVDAITSIIEQTRYPLVLTANDPWDPKISRLRNVCQLIELKRLGIRDSAPYLKKLCAGEGVGVDEKALHQIIERDHGDMRAILNDLQNLTMGKKWLGQVDIASLAWRDRKESVFDSLKVVFTAKNCQWAKRAVDLADVDYEMLFQWIYENLPYQLSDLRDLADGMDALSKADIHMARARRHQAWELLKYAFDEMTAGVALSRERTRPAFVPMKFPGKIRQLSSTREARALRNSIAQRVAKACHESTRSGIREYIPYLKIIFQGDHVSAAKIARSLDLDEEAVAYLAGEAKAKEIQRVIAKASPVAQ